MRSSDTSIASVAVKSCCACGADVAGQPRMKDSQGRYWCVPCGEADKRLKALTATTANCAGCHKPFSKGKLDKHGEHFFCKACLKKRTKAHGPGVAAAAAAPSAATASPSSLMAAASAGAATASPEGGPGERRRVAVLTTVLVALVVFAVLMNFVWAG
jgi:hypothetical protein